MISLGNPVMGTIRPHSDPPGPYWRVTATFGQIDADHPTPHQGVDIGNMKCGDPIVAVADGTVSLAAFVGAALVVRVKHPQFPGYESGYAHLSSKVVNLGQAVTRGQILGTLGMTGATACHLHFGLKLNGVEVDSWPLLEQNQEAPMPGFKIGSNIGTFRFVGAHALISPSDTKVRFMQPANAGPWDVAASLDLKKPDGTPVDIDGNSPPQNNRDQVYIVDAPSFGVASYALRQDGTFTAKVSGTSAHDAAVAVSKAAEAESAKYPA